ncbi:MAG: hypothetical protein Q8T09_01860 [Candidatus Melainabacteria bacterium]|nr:hypothetical protein [Candidatus Melainabacteria bacterium]
MFSLARQLFGQSQNQERPIRREKVAKGPRYTRPSGFGYQPEAVEGRGEPNPPPRYP